jgi:hypothetical protein
MLETKHIASDTNWHTVQGYRKRGTINWDSLLHVQGTIFWTDRYRYDRQAKGWQAEREGRKGSTRGKDVGECRWDIGERGWDVGECGWDIGECGWDVCECGWDIGECGWDVADCGWDASLYAVLYSRVVRASHCQCQSRDSPGFDLSILRYSGNLRWSSVESKRCESS